MGWKFLCIDSPVVKLATLFGFTVGLLAAALLQQPHGADVKLWATSLGGCQPLLQHCYSKAVHSEAGAHGFITGLLE